MSAAIDEAPTTTRDDAPGTLDVTELEQLLDSEPTCEVHVGTTMDTPMCGRPAAWLCIGSCGHRVLYCEPCHTKFVTLHGWAPGTRCGLCEAAITITWQTL